MKRTRAFVREMGLRDGLQSIKTIMPTAAKLEWIGREAACGVPEIEVASFVPAKTRMKYVPAAGSGTPVRVSAAPGGFEFAVARTVVPFVDRTSTPTSFSTRALNTVPAGQGVQAEAKAEPEAGAARATASPRWRS